MAYTVAEITASIENSFVADVAFPKGARLWQFYDAANQLIVDSYPTTQFITSYIYDPAGNRASSGYTNGGSPVYATTYTYDRANALLTSTESGVANPVTTYTYDAAGNRTLLNVNGAVTTYTWDYENRMVSASQPGGVSVSNTYLPNNRIVKASDAFGNLTTLTYDVSGANLLRRDVGGTSPATERYTQPPKDFGGLLAQVSTANPSARFYLPDLSRNIGILGNGSTVSEVHLLQAFGLALPGSTVPTTQPYGFQGDAGAYTDPITGLPVMWNRVYDSNIGQFLNPDPIGIRGGDPNYRRFVWNNPLRWSDPRGLWSETGIATCFDDGGLFCNHDPSNPKCPLYSHGMTGAWPNVNLKATCGCNGKDKRRYNPNLPESVNCGSTITVSKGPCSVTITIIDAGPNITAPSHAIVDLSPQAANVLSTCLRQTAHSMNSTPMRSSAFTCFGFMEHEVSING